jgi:hypothetical protein
LVTQNDYAGQNLNACKSVELHKKVIEAFIDELASADFDDFVDFYLHRNNDGHFEPFWTTI